MRLRSSTSWPPLVRELPSHKPGSGSGSAGRRERGIGAGAQARRAGERPVLDRLTSTRHPRPMRWPEANQLIQRTQRTCEERPEAASFGLPQLEPIPLGIDSPAEAAVAVVFDAVLDLRPG